MAAQNSKKQLTKNVLYLTIVQVATYVLPLVSVPVISRIIGPANYGTINFAAAYIAYFTLIIAYSFDFTATRQISKDAENEHIRNKIFSEVFYSKVLLFILSSIVFIILLNRILILSQNKTVLIFSYILCFSTLFTQTWLFQAMQDLSAVAVLNFLGRLIFTLAILIIIKTKSDYIWQPFLIGTTQTLVAISSFIWAIRRYKLKLVFIPLSRCLQVLWEEKTVFFSLIFVNLYSYTNTVILGLYQDPEQVGYYTAGQRLIIIAQSVLTMPLAQAFFPFIGKAFKESQQQGLQVVQKLIPLIVVFIGSASILMLLLGPIGIRLFFGEKFIAAVPVFQMLTFIPLLSALNNVLGVQIMLNLNMDKSFLTVAAVAAVVSILLNIPTVGRWGYMASTLNWLFTECFIFIVMYVTLRLRGINPIDMDYFTIASMKKTLLRK